ncbi:Alpha-amylase precursor [compost metagenome]
MDQLGLEQLCKMKEMDGTPIQSQAGYLITANSWIKDGVVSNTAPEQNNTLVPVTFNINNWTITINLPAGATVEFKAMKKDGSSNAVWESGQSSRRI